MRPALHGRELSGRDFLGAALAATERRDPALNAIVQKDTASAWRAANDSDARIARGGARPLEGPPVTIKDCFEVAGMVTFTDAPALQNYIRKMMRARWPGCALVTGPLAGSAADLALALDLLTGPRAPSVPAEPWLPRTKHRPPLASP